MKYKIGEKVIFLKKSYKNDSWKLNKYEEYVITEHSFNKYYTDDYNAYTHYYGVKQKNGSESTWYDEMDFIGLKEYRKLKLKKINGEVI